MFFEFDDHFYKQIRGLPMGCSLSGLLAIIFMDTLESNALHSVSNVPLFRRYVDDCFALVSSREEALHLLTELNSQHPSITFEIEHPNSESTLSLLDFTVTIDFANGHIFKFYRKHARKHVFVNHKSHLPSSAKTHFIRNEKDRIAARCTKRLDKQQSQEKFNNILRLNGYPDNIIHSTDNHINRRSQNRRNSRDKFFLRLPFVSDLVDKQVKSIFHREGIIPIDIVRRSRTLRNFLHSTTLTSQCHLVDCPIRDPSKCFRSCVVYKIICSSCHASYIGSTIRHLHVRIREHIKDQHSSVFQHIRSCSNNISVEILAKDHDEAN